MTYWETRHEAIVYYMAHPDYKGAIKIGTTVNMKTRLHRYRLKNNKVAYKFLTWELGDAATESERHRYFSKYHIIGEWFFYDGELRSHVESLLDKKFIPEPVVDNRVIQTNKNAKNDNRLSGISHSPYTHMLYCSGGPDGGHDNYHQSFSRMMQKGMNYYNGLLPTANQVLGAAMISSSWGKRPNLINCELCKEAFQSQWFLNAVEEMQEDKILSPKEYARFSV